MSLRTPWFLTLGLVLTLVACSSPETGTTKKKTDVIGFKELEPVGKEDASSPPEDTEPPVEVAEPPDTGPVTGPGAFGAPCTDGSECESGVCLPNGLCSKGCSDAADCLPGPEWTCGDGPNGAKVCLCTPSGAEACDGQDNDCDAKVDLTATCGQKNYTCQSGQCKCAPDNDCNGFCVEKDVDAKNCGACGKVCPKGATCDGGKCKCPIGLSNCETGECIDTTSNASHCGECNFACDPGTLCIEDKCGCPAATEPCNGKCLDVSGDASNCGKCGHHCQGSACKAGLCQPVLLVQSATKPTVLKVDEKFVYWGTTSDSLECPTSGIYRMPLKGGAPEQIVPNVCEVQHMQLWQGKVYFTVKSDPEKFVGEIRSVPVAGGEQPTVVVTDQAEPKGIAVDASGLYWVNFGNIKNAYKDGQIMALPWGESVPKVLTGNLASASRVAIDDTNVYWAVPGNKMQSLPDGKILKISKSGQGFDTVADAQSYPEFVAVDGKLVYWGTYGGGVVMASADGGAPQILGCCYGAPLNIELDAENIFFTSYKAGDAKGKLYRMPKGGGEAVLLTTDPAFYLTQTATLLFYADSGITKVAK